ncbi:hypothetical protein Dimus_030087 [Dionaea muscipula]
MFKLLCVIGLRTIWMLFYLVSTVIKVNMELCWSFLTWSISIVTLPARALSALYREKLMERRVLEMQNELETIVWSREELEAHLQVAIKEHRLMDSILTELEDDHEKAIVKIELLENEVHELKSENLRLQEIQRKGFCEAGHKDYVACGISSLKLSDDGSEISVDNVITHKDCQETVSSCTPRPRRLSSLSSDDQLVAVQEKEVAVFQSLFSASLSVMVGLVIREAEDPCTPLVLALFTVVSMSLISVVRFFLTINKSASDVVALVSLNWFILGTLTYPTLPRVACILLPPVSTCLDRVLVHLFRASFS